MSLDTRLLFRLLNDVQDSQDQLPVLQHALMRTWELWQNSQDNGMVPLDLEHYEATGGMQEALSCHADEVFAALPSEAHRTAAARLFKALTERGADGRGVRRPTRIGQLVAIAAVDEAMVHEVIAAYRVPGVTFLMPPVTSALDDGVSLLTSEISRQPISPRVTSDWTVRFYKWQDVDKDHPANWEAVLQSSILDELRMPRLHLVGEQVQPAVPPTPKVPPEFFAAVATSEVTLGEGEYTLKATADDGVRVWLDNNLVIDDWVWGPPRTKSAAIVNQPGKHLIKVEFFQAGWGYTLDVALTSGQEQLAKRQVNAAVALLRMNRPEKVWPLLTPSPDPRTRSYLIHRLSPLGADAQAIVQQLDRESDSTIRRALLLCLGEFSDKITLKDRQALLPKLHEVYQTAADAGLHAAAEWLLRQWKDEAWLVETNQTWAAEKQQQTKRLQVIEQELTKEMDQGEARWYVNGQGQTLVVISGPVDFWMGSPPTEDGRLGGRLGTQGTEELRHWQHVGHSFAIIDKKVTVEQFLRFRKDHPVMRQFVPADDCPVNLVSWYDAAAYCNWLSEQEGIPKEQWCYEPNAVGQYAPGMKLAPNYLQRTGYRLPTEAEWEFACRAGTITRFAFGESEELLPRYAWYQQNSQGKLWPVGSLKPNDFGLFDMMGNAWEWSQDPYKPYSAVGEGKATEDREVIGGLNNSARFVHRSGSFQNQWLDVRSAVRGADPPGFRFHTVGFRPARTLPFSSFDRYAAARVAALAAGQNNDKPPLDDAAKTKLRRQALDWLKAELTVWRKVQSPRSFIARNLWQWQQERDLADIRDQAALAKLPPDQQTAFLQFWTDVARSAEPANSTERLEFARAAVLIAAAQGRDEPSFNAAAKAKLGQQALDWLKAELSVPTGRDGKASIIAAAAPLPGLLAQLAESAPKDAGFQAELAGYYAEQGNTPLAEAARTKARALLEAQLAKAPENPALAGELAEVLVNTGWTVLKPAEMTSEGGTTLTLQPDESILASGVNPDNDVYVIKAGFSGRIGAIRLEAIPDPSLPEGGSGRSGNFILTHLRVTVGDSVVKWAKAMADFSQEGYPIHSAIDADESTGWAVWPHQKEPNWAVFLPERPIGGGDKVHLTIRLAFQNKDYAKYTLGRSRLSVASEKSIVQYYDWFPAATSPHARLGAAYLAVDDARRTADFLTKATTADPKLPPADWLILALAHARLRETAQLKNVCAKVAELLTPTGADAALRPLLREVLIALGPDSPEATALLAAAAGKPPAALNEAIQRAPDKAEGYRNRADWFAERGLWKESSADLAEAYRLEPDTLTGLRLGIVLIQIGEIDRYRAHCQAMLKRWGSTTQNNEADQTLKMIVLLPDFKAEAKQLTRLAKVAVSGDKKVDWYEWWIFAKALHEYRTGKYADALATCRESRSLAPKSKGDVQNLTSLDLAIEAMALYRSGDEAGAKRALAEAKSSVEVNVPGIDGGSWSYDWLTAHMLYHEAERLIAGKKAEVPK